MTAILINTMGILLIALVIWWFWIAKPKSTTTISDGTVEVIVENGLYTPSIIKVNKDTPIVLRFIRKDASPCAATVVFDEFNLSAELPIDKPHDIRLTPEKAGEFEFTCEMVMYRGKLIVE